MLRKLITPLIKYPSTYSTENHIKLVAQLYPTYLPTFKRFSSAAMEKIPKVDIDPSGVFKYILIKVHNPEHKNEDSCITIVRGFKRCNYHSDIYDEVQPQLGPFDAEPIGGGRISHEPDNKKIHIYGYSQGYGKADHEITAQLIKEAFPAYTITISDEGY